MVPLRLDAPRRWTTSQRLSQSVRADRPVLVLKDLTLEPALPSAPRRRIRRSPFQKIETLLLGASASAVAVFFAVSATSSLLHSIRQSYAGPSAPAVIVISKKVSRGDTLGSLAKRYGDPQMYLPVREEQIARLNHLSGATPLVPGQHLQIPVTSPVVIAQIERSHQAVASR